MSKKQRSEEIPVWMIVLLTFIAISLFLYSFVWAQEKASDAPQYQYLAYACLLIIFTISSFSMWQLIDRYQEGSKKNSTFYRKEEYASQLGKMSKRYDNPLKGIRRRK